jgi:hypothetical protein
MGRSKRNARGHYTPPELPVSKILGRYDQRDDAAQAKLTLHVTRMTRRFTTARHGTSQLHVMAISLSRGLSTRPYMYHPLFLTQHLTMLLSLPAVPVVRARATSTHPICRPGTARAWRCAPRPMRSQPGWPSKPKV